MEVAAGVGGGWGGWRHRVGGAGVGGQLQGEVFLLESL